MDTLLLEKAKMKRASALFLLFILLTSYFSIFTIVPEVKGADTPETEWSKTYGGTGYDTAYSVVQTSDGGYAVGGWLYSNSVTGNDFWLVKTDSSGNLQWDKTYGGPESETARSMVQTSDGGYALAGESTMPGEGQKAFWLAKTDSSGNLQWIKRYGESSSSESAFSVIQTSDGGYALAGSTYSFVSSSSDFWLVKTDSSGNLQWDKTYGGSNNERARFVIQTSDGGYALAGYTNSFGSGDDDCWLVKIDSSGNKLWDKTYGGVDLDHAYSVVQTSDNGYALAGLTHSYGAGSGDFWLVKTDSSGNLQWDKTYGGSSYDQAFSLIQTSERGYALVGSTASYGAGYDDFWLVKVGPEISSPPETPSLISPEDGFVHLYNWLRQYTGQYTYIPFTWSSSTGATEYELELKGPEDYLFTTTDTERIEFLGDGEYSWRVRAYNQAGYSDWTPTRTASIYRGWPSLPTLNSPSEDEVITLGEDSICTFSWTPSDQDYNPAESFTIDIVGPTNITETLEETTFSATLAPGEYIWFVYPNNQYLNPHADYGYEVNYPNYWSFTAEEFSGPASIILEPSSQTGYVGSTMQIQGTVRDPNGNPVEDVSVHTYSTSPTSSSLRLRTDENGRVYLEFTSEGKGTSTISANLEALTYQGQPIISNEATITWIEKPPLAEDLSLSIYSNHGNPVPSVASHDYISGESVTASVESPVTEDNTVWTCTGWSGSGSVLSSGSDQTTTFVITEDSSITWNWEVVPTVQHSLNVVSAHGSPSPFVGVDSYDSGLSVTASVVSPVTEDGVVWRCTGWTGLGSVSSSGSGTITTFPITEDSSITWNWEEDPLDQTLNVLISKNFNSINTDQIATITVSVTSNGSPVSNAQISLSCNGGSLTKTSGTTTNGQFTSEFSSKTTGSFTITATASKTSYTSAQTTTKITVNTPPPQLPDPPNLISPANGSPLTDTQVSFSWSISNLATTYEVDIKGPKPVNENVGKKTSFSTTLSTGTYSWSVRALNSAGESKWEGPWTFTITPPPQTKKETEITVMGGGPTLIEYTPGEILVTGRLTNKEDRTGLSNKILHVNSFYGFLGTTITDENGNYNYLWKDVMLTKGDYEITVEFKEHEQYKASSASWPFTVTKPENIQTKITLNIKPDYLKENTPDWVYFTGKLTRTDTSEGLGSKTIDISWETGSAPVLTEPNGEFRLSRQLSLEAKSYKVTALFNEDSIFFAARDTQTLDVRKPPNEPYLGSDSYISKNTVMTGSTFTAYYYITNPNSYDITVWLDCSLKVFGRTNDPIYTVKISDQKNDKSVTVSSGRAKYSRTFSIDKDAIPCSYEYELAILSGKPSSSGITTYDSTGWVSSLTIDTNTPIIYELFVEIDYMWGHEPTQSVLDYVEGYYRSKGIALQFIKDQVVVFDDLTTAAEFLDYESTYNKLGDDGISWGGLVREYHKKWKWVLYGLNDGSLDENGKVRDAMGICKTSVPAFDGGNYIFIADEKNDDFAQSFGGITEWEVEAVILMHELGHSIGIVDPYKINDIYVENYDDDHTSVMAKVRRANCDASPYIHYSDEYWNLADLSYYRK